VALLDRILENTSFTEPLPVVQPSSQEEVSIAEPIHSLVTHDELSTRPSPEPEDPEEEEILPPEFPFNIEEDIFYDFVNTTLYPLQKRHPVPLDTPSSLDKVFLKETVKRVAAVMNSEWIQEGETSSEIIQFHAPSLTIPCFVKGAAVTAFCNPTVGVNIISASFASDYSGERHVTPTMKSLRTGPHSIIKGIVIMQDVPVQHMKTEIALDFHIFDVQDFDIFFLIEIL